MNATRLTPTLDHMVMICLLYCSQKLYRPLFSPFAFFLLHLLKILKGLGGTVEQLDLKFVLLGPFSSLKYCNERLCFPTPPAHPVSTLSSLARKAHLGCFRMDSLPGFQDVYVRHVAGNESCSCLKCGLWK